MITFQNQAALQKHNEKIATKSFKVHTSAHNIGYKKS